ncbi:subtilisin-like protease SBT4.3 [Daucus carota subsp. sativus]|uniref:subtilisin-like protease SBT4.3 n=1 Tax=Daucus carota subsp. sativus TaxID=79200 RepID=UPI0007B17ADF|nr:PREDICTED: subtilisin-like protease SBT4.3 [Daucus carota subsp. sativus]
MDKSLFLSFLFLATLVLNAQGQERKVHIVYMGDLPQEDVSVAHSHHAMLQSAHGSASVAKKTLVFSYGRSFNGFAAKLTDEEAARVSGMKGVLSVFPSRTLKLHTTRSWDFVGLARNQVGGPLEGDVIIGLLDTGIWPESESFSDTNLGSPPSRWKGTCQGPNFNCSNKIIGARYYNSDNFYGDSDFKSPRDAEGHGTHTSSTAAGGEVDGASYLGLAEGTARGGAPGARIAMYKVCWSFGCSSADILKAFDDAIADGVDIISVSLGSDFPTDYFKDPIAIGSFHAMKYGILTSNSAGNSGPFPVSVANFAPWTLTVAASTIDRKFVAKAVLGNGQVFQGLSINSFDLNGTTYPLVWGGAAVNYTVGSNTYISSLCAEGTMNSEIVQGKMVFCETIDDGSGILLANGVGAIMADSYYSDLAFNYPLPATVISTEDGIKVLDYIRTTESPIATILVSDTPDDVMAPIVVSFSSRGPNPISPDILKPDITAPGVDILAAWSPVAPPSVYYADTRSVDYNIISGTSMSCPHAAGAAAHVKAVHPDWSPAAIKSALMTTATIMDPRKQEDLEFAYGSGQINPVEAVRPGLVYNASEADYINFLCKQGYNTTNLQLLSGDDSVCNNTVPGRGWDLNYPSFSLYVLDGDLIQAEFTRTVTNVGAPNSTYFSAVIPPGATIYSPFSSINITVEPSTLSFTEVGETKSFTVTVNGPKICQQPIMSGAILWFNEDYVVRAPLVVYNYLPYNPESETFSKPGKKKTFGNSSLYKKKATFRHK